MYMTPDTQAVRVRSTTAMSGFHMGLFRTPVWVCVEDDQFRPPRLNSLMCFVDLAAADFSAMIVSVDWLTGKGPVRSRPEKGATRVPLLMIDGSHNDAAEFGGEEEGSYAGAEFAYSSDYIMEFQVLNDSCIRFVPDYRPFIQPDSSTHYRAGGTRLVLNYSCHYERHLDGSEYDQRHDPASMITDSHAHSVVNVVLDRNRKRGAALGHLVGNDGQEASLASPLRSMAGRYMLLCQLAATLVLSQF